MMDPNKINRPVATVKSDAWYLRFYLWLWAADVEKVDFCRLFWGYVFAVPWFLVRFLIITPLFVLYDGFVYMKRTGIWKIIDGVEWLWMHTLYPPCRWFYLGIKALVPESERKEKPRKKLLFAYPEAPLPIFPPRRPSKLATFLKSMRENGGEVFLSGVGKTADKGVEFAQITWPYVKWIFILIGAVVAGVLAIVCGYLLWLLIGVIPAVAGGIWIAITATGAAIAWFVSTVFSSQFVWIVPLALIAIAGLVTLIVVMLTSRPAKIVGQKTAETTLGFGGAMKMGAKSVKYRTCPVIKIEEN